MSRVTKKKSAQLWMISFTLLMLYGCFLYPVSGPGYTVTVSVLDAAHLKVVDVEFLDYVAVKEGFEQRRVTASSDKWVCIHRERDLTEPRFQHLQQYKFITLGWCYDFLEGQQPDSKIYIKQFYVNIANVWQGQEPAIKQEIDRLGDVFYKALADRFGKENVKIERRRSGPPF